MISNTLQYRRNETTDSNRNKKKGRAVGNEYTFSADGIFFKILRLDFDLNLET
jgi:hypothetical protein